MNFNKICKCSELISVTDTETQIPCSNNYIDLNVISPILDLKILSLMKNKNLYNYLNKVSVCLSVSVCNTYEFRTLADFVEIHVQQPVGIVQNQINLAQYFFVSVTMCFNSQIQNI